MVASEYQVMAAGSSTDGADRSFVAGPDTPLALGRPLSTRAHARDGREVRRHWALAGAIAVCLTLLAAAVLALASVDRTGATTTVRGTGYQFAAPEGWRDQSDSKWLQNFELFGDRFDSAVAREPVEGFSTNVTVARVTSLAADTTPKDIADAIAWSATDPKTLEVAREELQQQLGELAKDLRVIDVSAPRGVTLAGEEAVNLRFIVQLAGRVGIEEKVIAVHHGVAYVVTYTALRDRFHADRGGLDRIVGSWRWREGQTDTDSRASYLYAG